MEFLEQISLSLQFGKKDDVVAQINDALAAGIPAEQIVSDGLLAGMDIVGEKFKNGEYFVPQVLISARAMTVGLEMLKPQLGGDELEKKGTVILGTVLGDLHDIGKNLVKIMLEGKGLTVFDLGVDVAPERFIEEAIAHDADVICCSALLTTTMTCMGKVVELRNEKGLKDKVKIMVGGAPVTQEFADSIGADVYTNDAASAAEEALKICLSK